jgi:hypothetical protein
LESLQNLRPISRAWKGFANTNLVWFANQLSVFDVVTNLLMQILNGLEPFSITCDIFERLVMVLNTIGTND